MLVFSNPNSRQGSRNIPRHDNLIIHTIQLHVLQPPPFINPLGNVLLPQPRQVGRVIHADLDPVRAKLRHQRRQQRSARRVGRLPRAAQRIAQDAQLEPRRPSQRLLQRLDELLLRLANVQRRQEDAASGVADSVLVLASAPDVPFVLVGGTAAAQVASLATKAVSSNLERLVKLGRRLDDADLVAPDVEARGQAVQLADERRQGSDAGHRAGGRHRSSSGGHRVPSALEARGGRMGRGRFEHGGAELRGAAGAAPDEHCAIGLSAGCCRRLFVGWYSDQGSGLKLSASKYYDNLGTYHRPSWMGLVQGCGLAAVHPARAIFNCLNFLECIQTSPTPTPIAANRNHVDHLPNAEQPVQGWRQGTCRPRAANCARRASKPLTPRTGLLQAAAGT